MPPSGAGKQDLILRGRCRGKKRVHTQTRTPHGQTRFFYAASFRRGLFFVAFLFCSVWCCFRDSGGESAGGLLEESSLMGKAAGGASFTRVQTLEEGARLQPLLGREGPGQRGEGKGRDVGRSGPHPWSPDASCQGSAESAPLAPSSRLSFVRTTQVIPARATSSGILRV